jgi:hypothetical protein
MRKGRRPRLSRVPAALTAPPLMPRPRVGSCAVSGPRVCPRTARTCLSLGDKTSNTAVRGVFILAAVASIRVRPG